METHFIFSTMFEPGCYILFRNFSGKQIFVECFETVSCGEIKSLESLLFKFWFERQKLRQFLSRMLALEKLWCWMMITKNRKAQNTLSFLLWGAVTGYGVHTYVSMCVYVFVCMRARAPVPANVFLFPRFMFNHRCNFCLAPIWWKSMSHICVRIFEGMQRRRPDNAGIRFFPHETTWTSIRIENLLHRFATSSLHISAVKTIGSRKRCVRMP